MNRISPQQAARNRATQKRSVVSAVQSGKTIARAAAYAGVTSSTIRRWRQRDRAFDQQIAAAMQQSRPPTVPQDTASVLQHTIANESSMSYLETAEALAAHWLSELENQGYDPDEYPHLQPDADWSSYCDGQCVDFSPCAACILGEVAAGTFDDISAAEALAIGPEACAA